MLKTENKCSLVKEQASFLIDQGFAIFPLHSVHDDGICTCRKQDCSCAGKHPAVESWLTEKTTNKALINKWWNEKIPFVFNIAIATGKESNLTVIDIDLKSGGLDTWAEISDTIKLPKTVIVNTGGGGLHYYFKYCKDLKTGTNVLGKGIDVRNDGGYIVAPPSIHKSGQSYKFAENYGSKLELAEIPQELINIANAPHKKKIIRTNKGATPLAKAEKLLNCISSDNYQTWINIGIILGREYDRDPKAFDLYKEWSDRWGGKRTAERDRLMKDAFFVLSQEEGSDQNLSIKSLWALAYQNGYKEGNAKIPTKYFVYIAESNSFIYLINGSQWIASAVDSMCEKMESDGQYIAPSKWLIANRFATTLTNNCFLPSGLISGYDVVDGNIYQTDHGIILNRFVQSHIRYDKDCINYSKSDLSTELDIDLSVLYSTNMDLDFDENDDQNYDFDLDFD